MKYFIYLNGCAIVFKHTEVKIPFEYWDGEVKMSMETFDEVEVIQITKISSGASLPINPEWDILDAKENWKICA
jgi:hypothetical protein